MRKLIFRISGASWNMPRRAARRTANVGVVIALLTAALGVWSGSASAEVARTADGQIVACRNGTVTRSGAALVSCTLERDQTVRTAAGARVAWHAVPQCRSASTKPAA